MAYLTKYSLKFMDDGTADSFLEADSFFSTRRIAERKILTYLDNHTEFDYIDMDTIDSLNDWIECALEEEVSWYSHKMDLMMISKLCPDIVFELSGEGADSDDIWIKYFRNGMMQECRATMMFPPFDEDKLE